MGVDVASVSAWHPADVGPAAAQEASWLAPGDCDDGYEDAGFGPEV